MFNLLIFILNALGVTVKLIHFLIFISFIFSQNSSLGKSVAFLKIKTIPEYTFNESINTYFKKNLDKKFIKRVAYRVKKKKRIKSRNLKKLARIIKFSEPNWQGYFGSDYTGGYFSLNLQIDEFGVPQVIIFLEGETGEENKIFTQSIINSTFLPAVNKKGEKVRSWLRINKNIVLIEKVDINIARLLHKGDLEYPALPNKHGISGDITFNITINKNGKIDRSDIIKTISLSNDEKRKIEFYGKDVLLNDIKILERCAEKYLKTFKYTSENVATIKTVIVNFSIARHSSE